MFKGIKVHSIYRKDKFLGAESVNVLLLYNRKGDKISIFDHICRRKFWKTQKNK